MSIQRLSDKQQWELFIPEMGYMALLRNLRNFDQANIDGEIAAGIAAKLSDPQEVAKSKQFPYAFHTAWLNTPGSRWKTVLAKALDLSVPNIPVLDGRNLILVDTSASMGAPLSTHSPNVRASRARNRNGTWGKGVQVPSCVMAAALFGIALGLRNTGNVDLWSFASGVEDLTSLTDPPPGENILSAMDVFESRVGAVGHGTQIKEAVQATYRGHDRVFIFTDMQSMPAYDEDEYRPDSSDWWWQRQGDVTESIPRDKHVYGFNLAGYTNSSMNAGSYRHEMGGLTDATFTLVRNIESGVAGQWPWE